jgi:hypothetical protein
MTIRNHDPLRPSPLPVTVDEDDRLTCPVCGSIYLHHGRVEVFNRAEDAPRGLHVVVDHDRVSADERLAGNPSARRHGVRITFWCEECEQQPVLCLAQHKGLSLVRFEYDPAAAVELRGDPDHQITDPDWVDPFAGDGPEEPQ